MPIASILLFPEDVRTFWQTKRDVYISPETLKRASSYSTERRRLKLYQDRSGNHEIPPEWKEDGVTVRVDPGHRYGYYGGTIYYSYLTGKVS